MAPAADDRPLGPPPDRLSPDEAAIWERLSSEHGAHLRHVDSFAFVLLVGALARAAEIRRAYDEADDAGLRHALLQMLASRQSVAERLLSQLSMPPMYRLGLG